jgi:hydroxyethylthiazole kinase
MIYDILERVRREKPLVHHITNWVTIYDCANITRAFGALPVMAHAEEESAEMAGIASSLVLNIGTLTPELVRSMIKAGIKANQRKIPVVLDAVGVGATKLRDEKAIEILEKVKITILKGNSSEIARIAGKDVLTRGVESSHVDEDMLSVARELAAKRRLCVVVTGKEDIVTDHRSTYLIANGHVMMSSIVGTGCMAASVIGAFAAVEKDPANASLQALMCYGIAGELAAVYSSGPGSFKSNFYDEVYNLDREKIERMQKVEKR